MRSPCSLHAPRQSQQNSFLHWLHVMCMQPKFFSMGRPHLGQGLVLAMIHVRFSLSAPFLTSHLRTVEQSTGRCASSLHVKQYVAPHLHVTSSALRGHASGRWRAECEAA